MKECEEMFKFVQSSRDSQLASHQIMHTSEACKEDEQSHQLEHYKTRSSV